MRPTIQRIFQATGAFCGWFAVLLQLVLLLIGRTADTGAALLEYFSYFTILTNLLVAVYYTMQLFRPRQWPGAAKTTSLAVYITIVGSLYNLLLRGLWDPKGWQLIADNLLHTVNPALFIIYWALFFRQPLPWRAAFGWLTFPLVYFLFILARGAVSHVYPYPHLNVDELGYGRVLLNALLFSLAFLFFSFLFIAIGRRARPRVYETTADE